MTQGSVRLPQAAEFRNKKRLAKGFVTGLERLATGSGFRA